MFSMAILLAMAGQGFDFRSFDAELVASFNYVMPPGDLFMSSFKVLFIYLLLFLLLFFRVLYR